MLTTTSPPRTATTALPIAPAPVGPASYFGNRAGQLGITVAASAGQVVLHLFAPAVDDPGQPAPDYHLAASLTAPGQSVDRLTMRGCGLGCFVARARWQPGTNHLTLHAGARRWAGGTRTISVPWPPHPDPGALTRLADTLRRTGRLIDNERVTSDTTTGPGRVQAIPITGPRFLAAEPYSNGRATVVDTINHPDRTTTILIAFPDQDIYAQLELDPAGRPVRERLTDPDHLITRTFIYPETR